MNIFDYFFSCFRYIINVMDHDFFGFGFTYLDFFLASSLIFIILRFLLQGFNETDRFNFFSLTSSMKDFSREYQMKNNEREKQVITTFVNHDLDNNTITNVRSTKIYRNGNLYGVVNEKIKG